MKELIKKRVLEAKKNIVLEKVSEYFDAFGFENAKMQEIANHTGLSVGALYKLFPSKERLFFEYISYQIEKFHSELVRLCSNIDEPRDMLKKFVEHKFSTFVSKKKAIEDPVLGDPLFFLKLNTRKSDPAGPIYEFLSDVFLKLNEKEPLKSSDHMKTAYLFNAYTMGFIEYWLNTGTKLDDDAAEVVERFLVGMRIS